MPPAFASAQRSRKVHVGVLTFLFASGLLFVQTAYAATPTDATALLRAAFDNWRARSSETTLVMTIHRPDWERHLSMKVWTRGDDEALARFTAPVMDAGNATLQSGGQTWLFNPKVNQVIKLPGSMLSQSWMGSDFSYNDLSKAEDVLKNYTHRILHSSSSGPHTVYTIESLPKAGAPVIWGKQVAKVRDDGILLEESYFDQDMKLVRTMSTERIARLDGREYPVMLTMHPAGEDARWTRVETTSGKFDLTLPDYLFTRSNLQNPRE